MSRDVVFDEMSRWYESSGDALKDDDDHDKRKNHKSLVVQRHHRVVDQLLVLSLGD